MPEDQTITQKTTSPITVRKKAPSSASPAFPAMKNGLLEFVVLKTINAEEKNVSELLEYLEKTPFATPKGTIYPLLRKLLRQNLVEQSHGESETGHFRDHYSITETGVKYLIATEKYWTDLKISIGKINRRQIMKDRDAACGYQTRKCATDDHTSTLPNNHAPIDKNSTVMQKTTNASTPSEY
jgi:PadR family transcriptional regulator PadR